MTRTARTILLLAGTLLTAAVSAASAGADGLPVLGIDVGPQGVAAQSAAVRYVTLPAGRDTLVARIDRNGGRVLNSSVLRGILTIPAVAYDGSASGLSGDGRTLVLIQPRVQFPRASTTFAVVDTKWLRLRKTIRLHGDFSFDAVSPRGRWVYLIQYVSPKDPNRYRVRALDARSGRLVREPVVDPRERGEAMRGLPITRAMSADGRWAYTLYDGGGKKPFVHALDTRRREARCIDLPMLTVSDLGGATLAAGGGMLTVRNARGTQAVVDLETFRALQPAAPASAKPADRESGFPWLPAAAATTLVAALAGGALVLVRRRARRDAPPVELRRVA